MHERQHAVLDALQRTQCFLAENADILGSIDFAAARRRLDEVVTRFIAHAVDQGISDRGAREESAKTRALQDKLRSQQMKAIAVIARRDMDVDPEAAVLLLPNRGTGGKVFLTRARDMLTAAAVHRNTLIAHGLPSTFIEDLRTAVKELSALLASRGQYYARRTAATKSLERDAWHSRTVLNLLDALLHQAAGDNESLLRSWQAPRRVRAVKDPRAAG